jgi:ATP-dependent Clp protease ATP-binding subunit ClpC
MFERFTDRSRKVMALANQEAIRHGHPVIDTEHILLGLVKEGTGLSAKVLKPLMGGDLRNVWLEVEKLMPAKTQPIPLGKLPLSKEAEVAIMFAIDEAGSLPHNYVRTEHLLLGILRQADGVAGRTLTNLGVTIDTVRKAILELSREGTAPPISQ